MFELQTFRVRRRSSILFQVSGVNLCCMEVCFRFLCEILHLSNTLIHLYRNMVAPETV